MRKLFCSFCLTLYLFGANQVLAQKSPVIFTEDSLLNFIDDRFYSFSGSMFPDQKSKVMFQISITRNDTSKWNFNNNYSLYKLYFRDSLLNIINNSKNEIERAKTYGELTNLNPYDSIDYYYKAARHLADSMALNSKNEKDQKALVDQIEIVRMFSYYYEVHEKYLKSFQLMNECILLSRSVNDSGKTQMDQIWTHLPKLYEFDQEEFQRQYEAYKNLAEKYDKGWSLKNIYTRAGYAAKQSMNTYDARKYYLLAYNAIQNSTLESEMVGGITYDVIQSNLSDIYFSLGQYDSSIYFIRNTIKSLEAGNKIPESFIKKDNSHAYHRIGTCFLKMAMLDSSYHYFKLASVSENIFSNLFYAGYTADMLGRQNQANNYLGRALAIQNKSGARIFNEPDSMEVAIAFSGFHERRKDYSTAYLLYKQFCPKYNPNHIIKQNQENIRKASYITYKFQQQKELFDLENKLQEEKQQSQKTMNIFLLGGSGGAMVLLALAFISLKIKRKRDVAVLSEQVSSVEMKSLRSQMNPHFIFNSLQSIQNFLINNKSEDANEYLLKFSKLMRLVLENSMQQEVALSDDILTLDLYMQLEQLRFTRPFGYEIIVEDSVDPEVDTIPPLLLQPFVENAIWHGLQYKSDPGKIMIRFKKEKDVLICVVEDNGVGRSHKKELKNPVMKKESLGMKLTEERIGLLQKVRGVEATLRVMDLFNQENIPSGTRVELLLPLQV